MLTRSHGTVKTSHPRTSTVGFAQDYNALSFARFQCVSNRALVNAFNMSGLQLHQVGGTSAKRSSKLGDFAFGLHYFSHPMPALYCFVIRWLRHTLHGVGCLVCHHERTRLTSTTINRAILVRCKNTKKLLIKSLFVWKCFIKTLNLTDFDLSFAVLSKILRKDTHL